MNVRRITQLFVLSLSLGALGAHAGIINYAGEVTLSTGTYAVLTPVGTPVAGTLVFDDSALGGTLGIFEIFGIEFNVGGLCFSTAGRSACPLGSVWFDSRIDSAVIAIDASSDVTGGSLMATTFSPDLQELIEVSFDFGSGTFAAVSTSGIIAGTGSFLTSDTTGGGGSTGGSGSVSAPATLALLGLGLLGLRLRRNA